ncbi:trace amine-associated receptor 3-like [Branchiostoma lanceolatum]|uniref:trace amine-associated receptor 3-like n=1 Tax=Branchiostoma lanceolatum TaxID=7740 RepID=UPI0034545143
MSGLIMKPTEGEFPTDFAPFVDTAGTFVDNKTAVRGGDDVLFASEAPYQGIQISYLVLAMSLSLVGNMAVIVVVAYDKKLRKPGNYLLCGLSCGDIVQSLIFVPTALNVLTRGLDHVPTGALCVVQGALFQVACVFSLNALSAIAFDRYQFICNPLHYQTRMTKGKIAGMLVICLILGLVAGIAPSIEGQTYEYMPGYLMCRYRGSLGADRVIMTVCCFIPTVVIMTYTYGNIFREARRHQKRLWRTSNKSSPQEAEFRRGLKTAVTIGIVFVIFWVSWLPFLVTTISLNYKDSKDLTTFQRLAQRISPMLYIVSTFTNPIIYCFRNRTFLKALCNLAEKTFGPKKDAFMMDKRLSIRMKQRKLPARSLSSEMS